ncbi:MAG: esterase family protein [Clostridia bacterium]|nr:esterase family protein [Clostridia bacterium]
MAVLEVSYFSKTLDMQSSMGVILPQKNNDYGVPIKKGVFAPFPVLYFLHGRGGDHSVMRRFQKLELYAQVYGVVIVMPDAHQSFYTDQLHGSPYITFLAEELPGIVSEFFHVSTAREDTFAAGISMGGYGAMKLALTYPEKYAACANMSGSPDISYSMTKNPFSRESTARILDASFGGEENLMGSKNDIYELSRRLIESKRPRPRMYITVGRDDGFAELNRRYVEAYGEALGIEYRERDGGHTWGFWQNNIADVFKWLNINGDKNT